MADGDNGGDRGAVVITGASTGIGRATALHLDDLGFRVFAGVRKKADGEALAAAASGRLTPLTIDVAKQRTIDAAAKKVTEDVGDAGIAGLFNNAGIGVGGPLEFLPIDDLRHQMEVNLIGQVATTQAFMPLIRAGHGRIVFTGSIGGRVSSPLMAPYSASKFALEAVAESLRVELQPWDIWVAIVEPGMIATDIWDKGNADLVEVRGRLEKSDGGDLYGGHADALEENFMRVGPKQGIAPEKVAKVVEHALTARRPRARYLVGTDAKMMARAKGMLSDRAFSAVVTRAMKMPRRGSKLEK
jgi:NAD(P)-dependent dehydrogenase (short-subunit alcohol dehydrogenase family)